MKTCGPQNLTRCPSRCEMTWYLDAHPEVIDIRFRDIRPKGKRSMLTTSQWGRTLYRKHIKEFNRLFYGWWAENPALWDAPLPEVPPRPSRALAGSNPLISRLLNAPRKASR